MIRQVHSRYMFFLGELCWQKDKPVKREILRETRNQDYRYGYIMNILNLWTQLSNPFSFLYSDIKVAWNQKIKKFKTFQEKKILKASELCCKYLQCGQKSQIDNSSVVICISFPATFNLSQIYGAHPYKSHTQADKPKPPLHYRHLNQCPLCNQKKSFLFS